MLIFVGTFVSARKSNLKVWKCIVSIAEMS